MRLAPALVGPPHTGVVLPGRASHRRRVGTAGLRRVRVAGSAPGRGRPRHVVLLPAVAVRDPRLAGREPGAARLVPERRQLHGPRDHLPLGGADDHGRARAHGRDPLPYGEHPLDDQRTRRPANVEEPRNRHRSARSDRRVRRRCDALRPAQELGDAGRPVLVRRDRGRAQARDQALERRTADPAERRGRQSGGVTAEPRGALDPRAARHGTRRARGRLGTVRLRGVDRDALPPHLRRLLRLVRGGRSSRGCTTATSLPSRPLSPRSSDCSRSCIP